MLAVAICDDNPVYCHQLEKQVNKRLNGRADIEIFYNAENLLTAIKTDCYVPQITLLGVGLKDMSGIKLAKELNRLIPLCSIIFLTDDIRLVPAVYCAEHVWLISMDETENYLGPALEKALRSIPKDETKSNILRLHVRGRSIVMPAEEVIYMERKAHETTLFTINGQLNVTMHPAELISSEISSQFIHCHQSFWVNCDFIRELVHDQFLLKDGQTIPLGRTYRKEAKERFHTWMKK